MSAEGSITRCSGHAGSRAGRVGVRAWLTVPLLAGLAGCWGPGIPVHETQTGGADQP